MIRLKWRLKFDRLLKPESRLIWMIEQALFLSNLILIGLIH